MPGTNGTNYQPAIQSQLENKNLVKIVNSILNLIPSVLSHVDDLSKKKILKEINKRSAQYNRTIMDFGYLKTRIQIPALQLR